VATEDAPVFERQDRLHRVSGEWIQPILVKVCYPLCNHRLGSAANHFAEKLLKM
jgi:hypothetical protein